VFPHHSLLGGDQHPGNGLADTFRPDDGLFQAGADPLATGKPTMSAKLPSVSVVVSVIGRRVLRFHPECKISAGRVKGYTAAKVDAMKEYSAGLEPKQLINRS